MRRDENPYTVKYKYEGQGNEQIVDFTDLDKVKFDINNDKYCTLEFIPEGYDNANFSGKNIEISVAAQSAVAASPAATVTARTLGPALAGIEATKAQYADRIEVTWNEIPGAAGYLVTRTLIGSSSLQPDKYYIDSANKVTLQVQPESVQLDDKFAAVSKTGTKFTLTDKFYKNISSEDTAVKGYYERQSRMGWGLKYAYSVVPLKGTDVSSAVAYKNQTEPEASVLGYGLNVRASKARAARKVFITWDNPPHVPVNAVYKLYRCKEGDQSYTPVNTAVKTPGKLEFTDGVLDTNGAYMYLVAVISDGEESDPRSDNAFRSSFGELETRSNFGYALNPPVIATVTRGGDPVLDEAYAENITWNAPVAGLKERGAQGYEIEIRNLNLENNSEREGWYLLDTVTDENPPAAGKTYSKDTQLKDGTQVLKVLYDYKHYYRIRAYNGDGDDRVYSDYSNVEWGARQITNGEFFIVAMESIRWAFIDKSYHTIGKPMNSLDKSFENDTFNHKIDYKSGPVAYKHNYSFSNFKPYFATLGGSFSYAADGGGYDTYDTVNGDWIWGNEPYTGIVTVETPVGNGSFTFNNVNIDLGSKSGWGNRNNPVWKDGTISVTLNRTTVIYSKDSGMPFGFFLDASVFRTRINATSY